MDVALCWNNALGEADIGIAGFDLMSESGLLSAVLISLFTDARVDADEFPDGENDRRGWWGDALSDGDATGSRLWLLERSKQTGDVLVLAEGWAQEALSWLVEDGIATEVEVTAEWAGSEHMQISVAVSGPDRSRREYVFEHALRSV